MERKEIKAEKGQIRKSTEHNCVSSNMSENLDTVQSNRTFTAVGREGCNFNKSYIDSCVENNRQVTQVKAFV
jgi:hypothetical protein